MASLKQKLKRLHRKNSKRHVFAMFFVLLVFLGVSCVARYYAFVPLRLMDTSMAPDFKERSVIWMCKLPNCLINFKEGDVVLESRPGNENLIRKILGQPGDTILINDKGQVTTPRKKFKWKNEDSFIQSRSFYVPKAGDTLQFQDLNDVEQDYVIAYLRDKGQHIVVKTTLWQGEHEIGLDRVGATKIANRQVSLNEIDFLPWQDRFLIETQIRQDEPGNAPISLRRKIFRGTKKIIPQAPSISKDTLTQDSLHKDSIAKQDSIAQESVDTTKTQVVEEIIEPITTIVIEDDCYYLVCSKGDHCPDSRESGYVTADKISGSIMETPTKIQNGVIVPAIRKIQTAARLASETFSQAINAVTEWFNSSEEPEEETSKETKPAKLPKPVMKKESNQK